MIGPVGRFLVTAAGTPRQILPPPTTGYAKLIHAIQFQSLPTNQGIVYVGTQGLVRATFANVMGLVARPSFDADAQAVALPAWAAAHTIAPNGLNLSDFWIDADFSNDGVIVTVIIS